MSRRELREWIFQTLFRMEFHNKEEYEKQLELLFETESDKRVSDFGLTSQKK